jgi:hypothetical protein
MPTVTVIGNGASRAVDAGDPEMPCSKPCATTSVCMPPDLITRGSPP